MITSLVFIQCILAFTGFKVDYGRRIKVSGRDYIFLTSTEERGKINYLLQYIVYFSLEPILLSFDIVGIQWPDP
jgi:hypothetical protein